MERKNNPAKKIIVIVFLIMVSVFACKKSVDPPSPPPPPPPPASTLKILSFDTISVGATTAKFTWKDSSNYTINSRSLTNNNTGESVNVQSLSTYEFKNLNAGISYSFTLKVGDIAGKTASSSLNITTKDKPSGIVAITKITYDKQFAIIGNCQSDTLRIKIKNLTSKSITIPSLTADFGQNTSGIKMLRYRFSDTSRWAVIFLKDNKISFKDLPLQPGENNMKAIFSLKAYPGVIDNSPIAFSFKTLDDGEGGTAPSGGWPKPVPVGNIDIKTIPTILTNGFLSFSYTGSIAVSAGSSGTIGISTVLGLTLTGPPEPARIKSMRLKNPYAPFTGMEWGYADPNNDFHRWTFGKFHYGKSNSFDPPPCHIPEVESFYWEGNDYVNLTVANSDDYCGSNALTTDGVSQDFGFFCGIKNHSNTVFLASVYTPGYTGFVLTSKFDFVIVNSSGQVLDASDANVTQDNVPVPY